MASMPVPEPSASVAASSDVLNASDPPRQHSPPAETSAGSPVPEPARMNGVNKPDRVEKRASVSDESRTDQTSELLATGQVSIKSEPSLGDKSGSDVHEAEPGDARPAREEKIVKTPRRDEAVRETKSQKEPASRRPSDTHHAVSESAPSSTRKHLNGTIGSAYSGSKIRHLKKDDGIPLWRKDIQYDFLRCVFEDRTPCFTRFSEGDKNLTFADLYLDTMAKSSKTSKILKDKLQNDRPAAMNIAMVCLLVNFGRMNTTLNCESSMPCWWTRVHGVANPDQFSQRCVHSYEPTTQFPPSKRVKTPVPTNSSKTRLA